MLIFFEQLTHRLYQLSVFLLRVEIETEGEVVSPRRPITHNP